MSNSAACFCLYLMSTFKEKNLAKGDGHCRLHARGSCRKFVYCSWAIQVNHCLISYREGLGTSL